MRLAELRALLDDAYGSDDPNALVMAIDPENPVPLSITGVKAETAEDGDGTVTVWITVEES
jgi:hypothetical protein